MQNTTTESAGAVYVQTNDPDVNEVVAYRRAKDRALAALGRYPTGGRGNGKPHLPSQSSLILARDGRMLLVANTGSADVSVFTVGVDGLGPASLVPSGGAAPTSVAVHEQHVYVLNTGGEPNVAGFLLGAEGTLEALPDSTRPLPGSNPAQVAFSPDGRTLVVTDRATNSIVVFAADADGYLTGPALVPSSGATP
jgi:6-phosphogluconolactonase (cycloisomerase 2 family)